MRPLTVLLALPLLGAAPPTTESAQTSAREEVPKGPCNLLTTTGEKGRPLFRKLDQLPPAETYAAVWRMDERGCPDPLKYVDR